MTIAINIYPTKASLRDAILSSKSILFDFTCGLDFFYRESTGHRERNHSYNQMWMEYETVEKFIDAVWRKIKSCEGLKQLRIDGDIIDMDKMVHDRLMDEAKSQLTNVQIQDSTLGLIHVSRAMEAKLMLEDDKESLEIFKVAMSMICNIRGAKAFGRSHSTESLSQYDVDDMNKAIASAQKAIKNQPLVTI